MATIKTTPVIAASTASALEVTTVFTEETRVLFGPEVEAPVKGLSALVENHLFLRQLEWKGELRRVLAILKTRESGHDPSLRELIIGDTGIQLGGYFDSTSAVLTDPGPPAAPRATRRSAARKKRGGRK